MRVKTEGEMKENVPRLPMTFVELVRDACDREAFYCTNCGKGISHQGNASPSGNPLSHMWYCVPCLDALHVRCPCCFDNHGYDSEPSVPCPICKGPISTSLNTKDIEKWGPSYPNWVYWRISNVPSSPKEKTMSKTTDETSEKADITDTLKGVVKLYGQGAHQFTVGEANRRAITAFLARTGQSAMAESPVGMGALEVGVPTVFLVCCDMFGDKVPEKALAIARPNAEAAVTDAGRSAGELVMKPLFDLFLLMLASYSGMDVAPSDEG